MADELKPVRCGCGGEAQVMHPSYTHCIVIMCGKCGLKTPYMNTEAEAITAWNRAMSGSAEEKLKAFWDGMSAEMREERTAKVIEHDASVTDTDGYKYHRSEYLCGACKKKILGGDEYCSHCGTKLDWSER